MFSKLVKRGIAALAAAGMLLTGLPLQVSAREAAVPNATAETLAAAEGRVEISFNNDWRFYAGKPSGAEKSNYDDSQWLYVNTPHSTIKYTPENFYHADLGTYWYRRHFQTPDTVKDGRKALLTFEGAMQKADVWLNDQKLGSHEGGYTEFSFDITDKLKKDGSENVLAVKLDTNPNTSFAPGKDNPDFQYFGGLYRNVLLTVTDPVHITDAVSSDTQAGGACSLRQQRWRTLLPPYMPSPRWPMREVAAPM